jgi:hypothetical protein
VRSRLPPSPRSTAAGGIEDQARRQCGAHTINRYIAHHGRGQRRDRRADDKGGSHRILKVGRRGCYWRSRARSAPAATPACREQQRSQKPCAQSYSSSDHGHPNHEALVVRVAMLMKSPASRIWTPESVAVWSHRYERQFRPPSDNSGQTAARWSAEGIHRSHRRRHLHRRSAPTGEHRPLELEPTISHIPTS